MKKIFLCFLLLTILKVSGKDYSLFYGGMVSLRIKQIPKTNYAELTITSYSSTPIYLDTSIGKSVNDTFLRIGVGCHSSGFPFAVQSFSMFTLQKLQKGQSITYKILISNNVNRVNISFDFIKFVKNQKDIFKNKETYSVKGGFLNSDRCTLILIEQTFDW